jgi:RNA polymerase sigma-70 factor (ECF subfamily)
MHVASRRVAAHLVGTGTTVPDRASARLSERFAAEALPHLPSVGRFARMMAGNEADADDLVQETFLRAFRAWAGFRPGGTCRNWLFAICRNVYLSEASRRSRTMPLEDPEADAPAAAVLYRAAVQRGSERIHDHVDFGPAVRTALLALPWTARSVILLVDVQDRSYEEAAAELGIPVGTVRSRLSRGRRVLQQSLLAFAEDAGFRTRAAG